MVIKENNNSLLKNLEMNLQSLLHTIPSLIVILSPKREIVEFSSKADNILGMQKMKNPKNYIEPILYSWKKIIKGLIS